MNALNNAAFDIINLYIPREVLEVTFPNEGVFVPLEERLINKCLRPMILKDMNLLGGVTVYVDINNCEIIATKNYEQHVNSYVSEFVLRVPKYLTNDKSIISALYVTVGIPAYPMQKPCTPVVMNETLKLASVIDTPRVITTSRLEVVGENLILIAGLSPNINNATLTVTVENNNNLENIQASYYKHVVDIMSKGVKTYIYNTLAVKLDKGYIYGGHELSVLKDIVDSYSNAAEEYNEALMLWKKISLMNDSRFQSSYIQSMLGITI